MSQYSFLCTNNSSFQVSDCARQRAAYHSAELRCFALCEKALFRTVDEMESGSLKHLSQHCTICSPHNIVYTTAQQPT